MRLFVCCAFLLLFSVYSYADSYAGNATIAYDAARVDAEGIIQEVGAGVGAAESKWVDVSETKLALGLADMAYRRGDYFTALERAKQAELQLVLEASGKINVWFVLYKYWWAFLFGLIVLLELAYLVYRTFELGFISRKLESLAVEKSSLRSLVKEAQENRFRKKSISEGEYYSLMSKYGTALLNAARLEAKLRNRWLAIANAEQALDTVLREKKQVMAKLKKIQRSYFGKKMSKKVFLEEKDDLELQLADLEKQEDILRRQPKRHWRRFLFFGRPKVMFPQESVDIDDYEEKISAQSAVESDAMSAKLKPGKR